MSINDKLTQLSQAKTAIKNAINAKGGNVGNNMTTYATAIQNIPHDSYNLCLNVSDSSSDRRFVGSKWTFTIIYADGTTSSKTLEIVSPYDYGEIDEDNVLSYTLTYRYLKTSYNTNTSSLSSRGTLIVNEDIRGASCSSDLVNMTVNTSRTLLSDIYLHATLEN